MRFYARNRRRFMKPVMAQLALEEAEELVKELDAIGMQIGPTYQKFVAYRFKEGLANTVRKVKDQPR